MTSTHQADMAALRCFRNSLALVNHIARYNVHLFFFMDLQLAGGVRGDTHQLFVEYGYSLGKNVQSTG